MLIMGLDTALQRCSVAILRDGDVAADISIGMERGHAERLAPIVDANLAKEARVFTDEAPRYKAIIKDFAEHKTVNHGADEYISLENPEIHTNAIENYFSVFKRGMKGVYQHCSKKHLRRYLAEFDFRYNNRSAKSVEDMERTDALLSGISGKRLTYRNPSVI